MLKPVAYALTSITLFVALSQTSIAAHHEVSENISFFLTSKGPGNGADLGGLSGADSYCHELAASVGAGDKKWRAYLSTSAEGNKPSVNARDRIGNGPWFNAKGVKVANNVDDLHSDNSKLSKENSISEHGEVINGRGDKPNRHDILSGSDLQGYLMSGDGDKTCANWTSQGEGSAQVGHHDRTGGGQNPTSWQSAHGSRGCSQENLQSTGGDGLFYCFAAE
jgi:hypothetical protein